MTIIIFCGKWLVKKRHRSGLHHPVFVHCIPCRARFCRISFFSLFLCLPISFHLSVSLIVSLSLSLSPFLSLSVSRSLSVFLSLFVSVFISLSLSLSLARLIALFRSLFHTSMQSHIFPELPSPPRIYARLQYIPKRTKPSIINPKPRICSHLQLNRFSKSCHYLQGYTQA